MELRKEYQEVLDAMTWAYPINGIVHAHHHFEVAIEKCQTFADRPRVQFTDDEIDALWNDTAWANGYYFVRHIMRAYDAKQSEPAEVPFDYEQWSKGSWQASELSECGKYWVTVNLIRPGFKYTMRKI